MKLQRSVSKFGLLASALGGIVGSGWLLGPMYAAQVAGPAAIFSWIIGGLLMMIIAITFAELGTMFPVAGSMVRFSHISHGAFVSFVMAWVSWLAAVIVAPIETMALLQYASNYIPHLFIRVHGSFVLSVSGFIIAAFIMLSMCFLNCIGIKWVTKTNMGIVFWKLIIPILTFILLFSHTFHLQNFTSAHFAPEGLKGILSALPAAGVIFSFIGYSPVLQLAGEARNPQKNIPFAILGALTLCIVLYAVLQIAFIGAINPKMFINGWNTLQFKGDAGPFAGILATLGFAWFVKILYFDAIISPFGTAFIYTAATARMNYAATINGHAPKYFLSLTQKGIPAKAIFTNFFIGLLFILPFPSWQKMVTFLVSIFVFAYAVGPIALMTLRKKLPDYKRPFKVSHPKIICFMAFYTCNLILFWTGWHTIWRMITIISVGMIYFFFMSLRKKTLNELKAGLWIFPYLSGVGLISLLGEYGGGLSLIPFGWDFGVIAIFAAIIFSIATNSKLVLLHKENSDPQLLKMEAY